MSFEQARIGGWEHPDLMNLLKSEIRSESRTLSDYVQTNPLAAINQNKDKFVIIRKFSSRIFDEKVDMLNQNPEEGGDHYPIPHFGMTLVLASLDYARSYNVYLPNRLKYKSVEILSDIIIIDYINGETTTNFDELNMLRTFPKLSEDEILREYEKLSNKIIIPEIINRQNTSEIESGFFGVLKLDGIKETYETEFEFRDVVITISISNSTRETNRINLINAEHVFTEIEKDEEVMIHELCDLKNRSWLGEDEKSFELVELKEQIKLYGCDIYQNGSVSLYYKAGDLFLGHEVQMNFNSKGEYIDLSLIG